MQHCHVCDLPVIQGTSQVLRLCTRYPYKVLSLSTKPEVPCCDPLWQDTFDAFSSHEIAKCLHSMSKLYARRRTRLHERTKAAIEAPGSKFLLGSYLADLVTFLWCFAKSGTQGEELYLKIVRMLGPGMLQRASGVNVCVIIWCCARLA
jgi:hypothetical protein